MRAGCARRRYRHRAAAVRRADQRRRRCRGQAAVRRGAGHTLARAAGFSERRHDTGYGLYGTDPGDDRSRVEDGQSFVDGRYEGSLGQSTSCAARAFYNRAAYDGVFVFSGDLSRDHTVGQWWGRESQVTHEVGPGHRLIAGADFRRNARSEVDTSTDALGNYVAVRHSSDQTGVFAQDDMHWTPAVSTSAGLRHDRTGNLTQTSPRFALIWRTTAENAFKLFGGNAFRAPTTYEGNYFYPGIYLTSPGLGVEKIHTLDLDYETLIGRDGRLAVTAHRYRATGLITLIEEPSSGG